MDADIDDFFDSVNHKLMLKKLAVHVNEREILKLVKDWLESDVQLGYFSRRPTKGLPQGSPIAPVLANLFLDELDESLKEQGFKMVRYADDFLVLCKEEQTAHKALEAVDLILDKLNLELHEGKTEITSFHEGFEFLGTSFIKNLVVNPIDKRKLKILASQASLGTVSEMQVITSHLDKLEQVPWLPTPVETAQIETPEGETDKPKEPILQEVTPTLTDALDQELPDTEAFEEKAPAPDGFLRPLYLHTQGSTCSKDAERILITKQDQKLLDIPIIKVEQIIIFGHAHLSTRVIQTCLARNIPITYLSSYGSYHGRIENPRNHNIMLQQKQFERLNDDDFKLTLVKNIISTKLHNSRAQLLRTRRSQNQHENPTLRESLNQLLRNQQALNKAQTLEELRGFEGASANAYFKGYAQQI